MFSRNAQIAVHLSNYKARTSPVEMAAFGMYFFLFSCAVFVLMPYDEILLSASAHTTIPSGKIRDPVSQACSGKCRGATAAY
jgi:hypothetical protein